MLRSLKKRVNKVSSNLATSSRHGAEGDNHSSAHNNSATARTTPPRTRTSSSQHKGSAIKQVLSRKGSGGAGGGASAAETTRQEQVLQEREWSKPVDHLQKFDACLDAADALATAAGHLVGPSSRRDQRTGLPDCAVLVSPNGDLLLVPQGQHETLYQTKKPPKKQEKAKEEEEEEVAKDSTASSKETDEIDSDLNDSNNSSSLHSNSQSEIGENHESSEPPSSLIRHDSVPSATENFQVSSEIVPSSQDHKWQSELLHNNDEYESAVFLGHDLNAAGDAALNRFSGRGWSAPATSWALQQTESTVYELSRLCEELALIHKEAAARTTTACDQWRRTTTEPRSSAGMSKAKRGRRSKDKGAVVPDDMSDDWLLIDPKATDFELTPHRMVGPLLAPESSLGAAMMALDEYQSNSAEQEANRWREASLQRKGLLPALQTALQELRDRSRHRQDALHDMSQRARRMEERLALLKRKAAQKWQAVYKAEDKVTKRMEEILQERRRERELRRLQQLREAPPPTIATMTGAAGTGPAMGATSEEIWDIVQAAAESMEDGSFEPMDVPSVALGTSSSRDSSVENKKEDNSANPPSSSTAAATAPPPATPERTLRERTDSSDNEVSRELVEQEMGLPKLRAEAMWADEAIEDAAGTLLNILSNLDTTRRSARIAAETCLVSASNAQVACLRSLIQLERASLEERLENLNKLERATEDIDVRADLDTYIATDKKDRGGSSHLGDDDDGGIAAALAILSSHVEGTTSFGASSSVSEGDEIEKSTEGDEVTPEALEEILDQIFNDNKLLQVHAYSKETQKAKAEFERSVDFICKVASDTAPSARAKRSSICYALNSKRSVNAQLKSSTQFDGLCRLFSAILTGCNTEDAGVANAKMCMMLSQTFYQPSNNAEDEEEPVPAPIAGSSSAVSPLRKSRSKRVYVKHRLSDHPIWSNDEFWDQALCQCVSESLTHSGVMANFERYHRKATGRKSEFTQTSKTKWHDLTHTERIEAASQVHAVVFAQLGALAHSMIEFNCGLERSCAFVRRMAVRNQLPSSQRTMLLMHLMDRDNSKDDHQKGLPSVPPPPQVSGE